jgi:hypothetical protein
MLRCIRVAEAAEVDDALDSGALRGRPEVLGRTLLDLDQVLAIAAHQVGEVVDDIDPLDGGGEAVHLREISGAKLAPALGQRAGLLALG